MKSSNTNSRQRYVTPLAVGTVAALVLLLRLGQGSLQDWDEAIYAQVAREIIQSGSWSTLHWNFVPWFEKPPLQMWATALLYKFFGVNELWARAASALSGVGAVVVTYLIGESEFDSTVGILSSAVLLTTFGFVLFARMGMTDMMLTFFIYLAGYAYLRVRRDGDERWWYLVWSSCALAIMVKSAAGVIPVIIIGLVLLADGELTRALKATQFWGAILLGLLIAVPWHLVMIIQHGRAFTSNYIGYQIVERAEKARVNRGGGPSFYVIVMARDAAPWFGCFPFAFVVAVQKRWRDRAKSWLVPIAAAVIFGICLLVRTKLYQYIIPIYPAMALMTGYFLVWTLHSRRSLELSALAAALALSVEGSMIQFYGTPSNLAAARGMLKAIPLDVISTIVVVVLFFFAMAAWRAWAERDNSAQVRSGPGLLPRCSAIALCGVFLVWGMAKLHPLYKRPETAIAYLAGMASSHGPDDREPLIVFSMPAVLFQGINCPTPLFYSDRPTLELHTREELAEAADQPQWRRIIFENEDLDWLRAHYAIRIMATKDSLIYGMIRDDKQGSD